MIRQLLQELSDLGLLFAKALKGVLMRNRFKSTFSEGLDVYILLLAYDYEYHTTHSIFHVLFTVCL